MKSKSTFYAVMAVVTASILAGCQPATQRHTPPPADAAAPAGGNVSSSDPGAFKRTSPPPFSP